MLFPLVFLIQMSLRGFIHRYMGSNHMTIGPAIPELQLSGPFWHPSRGTRYPPGRPPQMSPIWLQSTFIKCIYPTVRTAWSSDVQFQRYKPFKSVTQSPGRPAAQTQPCPLFKKELRSELRVHSQKYFYHILSKNNVVVQDIRNWRGIPTPRHPVIYNLINDRQ